MGVCFLFERKMEKSKETINGADIVVLEMIFYFIFNLIIFSKKFSKS